MVKNMMCSECVCSKCDKIKFCTDSCIKCNNQGKSKCNNQPKKIKIKIIKTADIPDITSLEKWIGKEYEIDSDKIESNGNTNVTLDEKHKNYTIFKEEYEIIG